MINTNEYRRIHEWLIRKYGNASKCEHAECIQINPKRYEWALRKGMSHQKNRDNYIMLCPSCHRKYDYTEDQRKRQSDAARGRILSEETKRKLSAAGEGKNSKAIIQKNLQGEIVAIHNSVNAAATITGIKQSAISNVLTSRAQTSGGYMWQYVTIPTL